MPGKRKREKREYKRVSILQELYFGRRRVRSSENICETGMFISTPDIFMEGSTLDIKFKLYNNRNPISVQAEVRHAEEGIGMGVRFVNLRPEDRRRIREFVRKHSK